MVDSERIVFPVAFRGGASSPLPVGGYAEGKSGHIRHIFTVREDLLSSTRSSLAMCSCASERGIVASLQTGEELGPMAVVQGFEQSNEVWASSTNASESPNASDSAALVRVCGWEAAFKETSMRRQDASHRPNVCLKKGGSKEAPSSLTLVPGDGFGRRS